MLRCAEISTVNKMKESSENAENGWFNINTSENLYTSTISSPDISPVTGKAHDNSIVIYTCDPTFIGIGSMMNFSPSAKDCYESKNIMSHKDDCASGHLMFCDNKQEMENEVGDLSMISIEGFKLEIETGVDQKDASKLESIEKENVMFKHECDSSTVSVSNDRINEELCNLNIKRNEIYLPDVVPYTETKNIDLTGDKLTNDPSDNALEECKDLKQNEIVEKVNCDTEGETKLQELLQCQEIASDLNSTTDTASFPPLRSALKKGNRTPKKNLKVSFSDSEIIFVESSKTESFSCDDSNSSSKTPNWDQWEEFSAALQLTLKSCDEGNSDSLQEEKSANADLQENNSLDLEHAIVDNLFDNLILTESCQNIDNKDTTLLASLLNDNKYFQTLTEANVKKHQRLLLDQTEPLKESDSESASSQDTIIMMTTEESLRNQELIQQSQRRYKQHVQGSSSSSSHDSDELSSPVTPVTRSNSSVRRCLERTALRRSLTRGAEIRRRIQNISNKQDSTNSSLMDKLRLLTQECDGYNSQDSEDLNEKTSNGVLIDGPSKNNEVSNLPRLDLQQVQNLLNKGQPVHKCYSSGSEINVPVDVRQWKMPRKLTDESSENYYTSEVISNGEINASNFFESERDPVLLSEPLNTDNTVVSSFQKLEPHHSNLDELENFVLRDQDRIERIKRRYNSEDEQNHDLNVQQRQPSVRGIRPKFGSTTQIIKRLQQQVCPPMLLRRSRSHLTWPYTDQTESSNDYVMPPQNSGRNSLYLPNRSKLETVVENKSLNNSYDHLLANDDGGHNIFTENNIHNYQTDSYNIPYDKEGDPIFDGMGSYQVQNASHFRSCPPYIHPPNPARSSRFQDNSFHLETQTGINSSNNSNFYGSFVNNDVIPNQTTNAKSSYFAFDV